MAKKYYDGRADRRMQEARDAGMISENPSAIANLPQEVMIKSWPQGGAYLPEPLNDSISGVNKQMNEDAISRKSGYNPEKLD